MTTQQNLEDQAGTVMRMKYERMESGLCGENREAEKTRRIPERKQRRRGTVRERRAFQSVGN